MRIKSSLLILFLLNVIMINGICSEDTSLRLFYKFDNSYKYSIKTIHQWHKDKKLISGVRNFNPEHTAKNVWIALDLDASEEPRFLVIENAHLDHIDLYYYSDNSLIGSRKSGDFRDFNTRDFNNNFFNFNIPAKTTTIFMEVHSEGPLVIPIKVLSYQNYFKFWGNISVFHWLYFGLIFFSILSNLLLILWLKEGFYFYFLLCLISGALITAVDFGYSFQYLWPHHPEVNQYNYLFYFSSAFPILFLEKILNLKKEFPKLYKGFQLIYAFTILAFIISIFIPYRTAIEIIYNYYIIVPIFSLLCVIYIYVSHKQEYSQFILMGLLAYFGTSFIYILAIIGEIEYNVFTNNIGLIGSGLQIIFTNLAILSKIKILKEEKEDLLSKQNKMLEEKVLERTNELNLKNAKIINQNKAIEEKNKLLRSQQESLEKLVEKRTEELEITNEELVNRNNRLEQFAFVTAHNLRGPVATLLGLSQIFNKSNIADPLNLVVVDKAEEITQKLDGIIKDLALLLDLERDISSLVEPVVLENTLDEVKVLLEREIKESGAIISEDFSNMGMIYGVPAYISNIFYNLISNSIKYRRYNLAPEIRIYTESKNDIHTIVFQDNGMGIDMKKYGASLGNPYKRFHPDIKGKGLGLFITKKQIEAMKGSIEIESMQNKGMMIKILLKDQIRQLKEFEIGVE